MSKNLVFGEKAKITTFRLYSWERPLIKAYIKIIRANKRKELERGDYEFSRRNTDSQRQKLGKIGNG